MPKSKGPDKVVDFKAFGDRPARGRATALYIGSKVDARDEAGLRERGITHILNCTPPRSMDPESGCPNFFEGTNKSLTYKRIPIFDNRGEDILSYMPGAIAFIEQAKHYGSVLVHCNKGVSRSASFVLGYLMKTGGLSLPSSSSLLCSKRKICAPNESFLEQLRKYEEEVREGRREEQEKRAKHGMNTQERGGGGGGGVVKGPSVGPARGPGEGGGEREGRGIGPSLPPHLMQQQQQQQQQKDEKEGGKEGEEEGGKEGGSSLKKNQGPAIGPSHPPPSTSSFSSSSSSSFRSSPIGPSLPPGPSSSAATAPASVSASSSSLPQQQQKRKAVVGPSLPPGIMNRKGEAATKEEQQQQKKSKGIDPSPYK